LAGSFSTLLHQRKKPVTIVTGFSIKQSTL